MVLLPNRTLYVVDFISAQNKQDHSVIRRSTSDSIIAWIGGPTWFDSFTITPKHMHYPISHEHTKSKALPIVFRAKILMHIMNKIHPQSMKSLSAQVVHFLGNELSFQEFGN